jgi:long-chain acyl-CoA synthetase
LTHLSDLYEKAEGILNVFIHADSHHNYPVAVNVPTSKLIEKWKQVDIPDPMTSSEAQKELLSYLQEVHKHHSLRGFERIIDVHIDSEEFSIVNGLMTPPLKPQIQSLRRKYEQVLVKLLDESDS